MNLKMLSATGRTRLPVRSFCPPPVKCVKSDVWKGYLEDMKLETKGGFVIQNRGKIHSLKNAVCYRKDKADGTQFLPSPCAVVRASAIWVHRQTHSERRIGPNSDIKVTTITTLNSD